MYQEINQQLETAQQQIFRRKKLNAMLEELHGRQKELADRVQELKNTMEEEQEDVERLEKQSVVHLFYSVLGKLGDQVDKEQKEALAAKLKYEQAAGELEQLNGQVELLEEEFLQYKDCQRVYDSLYEKKKEHMLTSHSRTAEELMLLQEQFRVSDNNRKEIEEAMNAGQEVLRHIEQALNSLDSAEGWGTWDLLGGGLISDMMKHSHIDEAKAEADLIQRKLSQFRTELADVRIQNEIHFETDGFGKFADFFFDGLIADWCMQSRITESAGSIENVKRQVNGVLAKLSSMAGIESARREEMQRKMNVLIIRA
jgi:DNA repair exonuclease SbcCD ATPase subunit